MAQDLSIASRYELLLQINEIARRESTTDDLFQRVCAELGKLIAYDRTSLTLYDAEHDSLKIESLYGSYDNSAFVVGAMLPRKDTQNGLTFDHQRMILRCDLRREFQFRCEKLTLDEGYRSLCSVPLIFRGNSLGVVTIVGTRTNQFSMAQGQLVQEVSNQITPAIVSLFRRCPVHFHSKLVCPKCLGAAGGRTTVSKHHDDLSAWGKKGGRGKKQ
jgi:GAF domain-containing protein